MKLVIASNNEGKISEIRRIFGGLFDPVLSMRDAGAEMEIVESGETFRDNALIKAKAVFDRLGCAVLADDSGLEVDALCGRPGVYSARFAGEPSDPRRNNKKLLELLKDVPDGRRGAQFVCCAALFMPGRPEIVSFGAVRGAIAREPSGDNGFGYDPLFYYPRLARTFGQLSDSEKNAVSHRALALEHMRKQL